MNLQSGFWAESLICSSFNDLLYNLLELKLFKMHCRMSEVTLQSQHYGNAVGEKVDLKTNKKQTALAGVAQWIEHWPANQRVTSSIPSQGTCLDCRPGPRCRVMWYATTH